MKKLVLLSAIAMSGLLCHTADAQFGIHVGFRLFPHRVVVSPGPVVIQAPVYQPVANEYNNYDDFYYLPDVGAYYSVDEQLYYYQDGDQWIATAYLPGIYSDFDWRYARRIEIREARPYLHNDFYRNEYQGYDCDLVRNHDHFRAGFDFHRDRYAYNNQQRFDNHSFDHRFDNNRGGYNQHMDNKGGDDHRFDNKGGNDQRFDNRGTDNRLKDRGQAGFNRKDDRNQQQSGQQFEQNRDKGNRAGQQAVQGSDQDQGKRAKQDRLAQNDKGYNGHKNNNRDR